MRLCQDCANRTTRKATHGDLHGYMRQSLALVPLERLLERARQAPLRVILFVEVVERKPAPAKPDRRKSEAVVRRFRRGVHPPLEEEVAPCACIDDGHPARAGAGFGHLAMSGVL